LIYTPTTYTTAVIGMSILEHMTHCGHFRKLPL
jgi:hypothetical protein